LFFIKTYHASQGIRLPYEADVDNRKVFVDRLPRFVKLADLKSYFSAFGRIEDIQLNLRMGSFSAFVVYKSVEAAKKAVDAKHKINGVKVR
jgi:RNA recognition motif-containing protein